MPVHVDHLCTTATRCVASLPHAGLRASVPYGEALRLAWCSTYAELPRKQALAVDTAALRRRGTSIGLRIGIEAVGMLAAKDASDLVACRAQTSVSRAQLIPAGLSPNLVAPTVHQPFLACIPVSLKSTSDFDKGPSCDISSLLTLDERYITACSDERGRRRSCGSSSCRRSATEVSN